MGVRIVNGEIVRDDDGKAPDASRRANRAVGKGNGGLIQTAVSTMRENRAVVLAAVMLMAAVAGYHWWVPRGNGHMELCM